MLSITQTREGPVRKGKPLGVLSHVLQTSGKRRSGRGRRRIRETVPTDLPEFLLWENGSQGLQENWSHAKGRRPWGRTEQRAEKMNWGLVGRMGGNCAWGCLSWTRCGSLKREPFKILFGRTLQQGTGLNVPAGGKFTAAIILSGVSCFQRRLMPSKENCACPSQWENCRHRQLLEETSTRLY